MSIETSRPTDSSPVGAEQRAHRRLAAEKSFYVHLVTYVIVISALFVINALTGTASVVIWLRADGDRA